MPYRDAFKRCKQILGGVLTLLVLIPVSAFGALDYTTAVWNVSFPNGPFGSVSGPMNSTGSTVETFYLEPTSGAYNGSISFTVTGITSSNPGSGSSFDQITLSTAGMTRLTSAAGSYRLQIGSTGSINNMIDASGLNSVDAGPITGPTSATGGTNPQTVTFTFTFSNFTQTSSGTPFTIMLD